MQKILEKLNKLQSELSVPKNQRNSFGKYNYRSCEDIFQAVKPMLNKYKLVLVIDDEIVAISDRIYVKATATLFDVESDEEIETTALARESAVKKGMDDSQITGATSSYARKYALNGLFLLDDNKDADTDEHAKQSINNVNDSNTVLNEILELANIKNITKDDINKVVKSMFNKTDFTKLSFNDLTKLKERLAKK